MKNKAIALVALGLLVLVAGAAMPDTVQQEESTCTETVDHNFREYCLEQETVQYEEDNDFKPATIMGGAILSIVGGWMWVEGESNGNSV